MGVVRETSKPTKKRKPLEWYGQEGDRLGYPACDKCMEYFMQPGFIEACASVGIEHGKSTGQMAFDTTNHYHATGHKQ